MLRYLSAGPRDFTSDPVPVTQRLNWEFYAISSGQCAPYFATGKNPILRAKALWLLPAHSAYGWRGNAKPIERLAFHYSTVPQEVSDALGNRKYLAVSLDSSEIARLTALVTELEPHWKSPHQYSHLASEKAVLELSILILKQQSLRRDVPLEHLAAERVERALTWFNIHLMRNPTVDEVAAALHMSGAHLRRLFRQIRNQSPHEAFRELQIRRATDLLATSQHTQEEIARQCGFRSLTDFSRVFRKEMDTTADKWRRKILEREPV